jgi:hypothetical protein
MKIAQNLLHAMIFAAAVGSAVGCSSNSAPVEATAEEAEVFNSPSPQPEAADSGFTYDRTHRATPDTATEDELVVPPHAHDPYSCPACGMG